jgi:hypothetical protein
MLRSQIAVRQAGPVRGGQHLRDRHHHAQCLISGQRPAEQALGERGPGNQVPDDIRANRTAWRDELATFTHRGNPWT